RPKVTKVQSPIFRIKARAISFSMRSSSKPIAKSATGLQIPCCETKCSTYTGSSGRLKVQQNKRDAPRATTSLDGSLLKSHNEEQRGVAHFVCACSNFHTAQKDWRFLEAGVRGDV